MLTKKQWQWAADNSEKVRDITIVLIVGALVLYVGLMVKTIVDKGKSSIPSISDTYFSKKFDCAERIKENFAMHRLGEALPADGMFFEDASILSLQRHTTYMYDINFLKKYPDCLGAMLAGSADNLNPFVVILYDRVNRRVVYRIARIDEVVKK